MACYRDSFTFTYFLRRINRINEAASNSGMRVWSCCVLWADTGVALMTREGAGAEIFGKVRALNVYAHKGAGTDTRAWECDSRCQCTHVGSLEGIL
jgi:hypothetical protein